ncbi:MAG TPA: class II aldolase/adducin family protein [Anaerolineaceae bacterium]|nr:class II aldolase/adducin family protein [Anaerolineaceae bacterium]
MDDSPLSNLVELSHSLARPELDYVILGEGNTSARVDDGSFWVKASGARLENIQPDGFVQMSFPEVLELLHGPVLDDRGVKEALTRAKVDPSAPGHPSVETLLHAQLLSLDKTHFVGHTHPSAINAVACSKAFPEAFGGRLFPDEIVLCGVAPLLVPYTDPGIPLARLVGKLLVEYVDRYGEPPRTVIMQNHGFIALGKTAQEVLDITAMATKTARILAGTYTFGGPNFLSQKDVERIHTRPDERYRQMKLGLKRD